MVTMPTEKKALATRDSGTGCLVWIGAKTKDGYGRARVGGRTVGAHRASYEKSKGQIPEGYVIMHLCDNRSCVNPSHLVAGTKSENTRDMDRKGRRVKSRKSKQSHGLSVRQRLNIGSNPVGFTGCRIWKKYKNLQGYGTIGVLGKVKLAHRASYEDAYDKIPDGMLVLHRCDVRSCIEPSHLSVGTNSDNMLDCVKKGRGRHRVGERSHLSKMTEGDAIICIKMLRDGFLQREIAEALGVTQANVSYIKMRKTWKHLDR